MTYPRIYPWTARLQEEKKWAHKEAIRAGKKWQDGAKEWLSFADLREKIKITREERKQLAFGRNQALNEKSSARRFVLKKLDTMTIATGCRFIRSLTSKRPVTKFNGYGYVTVGYTVSRKEYEREKEKFERRQAKIHYHVEICECPSCEGYGLGEWRENRRTGDMFQMRCGKCNGSGRIEKKVRGKGDDETLEWDGTLTSTWLANGMIEEEDAQRIRQNCKHRHEKTNYDDLLASGMSKEDARTQMVEK